MADDDFSKLKEAVSLFTSASEAGYYINKQITAYINDKRTNLLIQVATFLALPENAEMGKWVIFTPLFGYLLSNIQTKQVQECYQRFIESRQNPCERSLIRIIEQQIKEEHVSELEPLLASLAEVSATVKLSEVFAPLLLTNNLQLIRKYLPLMSCDAYGYMDVWEKLIDLSAVNQHSLQQLKDTLYTLAQNSKKPEFLFHVYNSLFQKLFAYATDIQFISSVAQDMVRLKVALKEASQTILLKTLIAKEVDFREVLKITLSLNVHIAPIFDSLLRFVIEQDRKFEMFCLIELILQEAGYCFKFEDLILSQQELRYIIVQQSFINRFLAKLERKQEVSFDSIGKKQYKEDYILECVSFASEVSEWEEI